MHISRPSHSFISMPMAGRFGRPHHYICQCQPQAKLKRRRSRIWTRAQTTRAARIDPRIESFNYVVQPHLWHHRLAIHPIASSSCTSKWQLAITRMLNHCCCKSARDYFQTGEPQLCVRAGQLTAFYHHICSSFLSWFSFTGLIPCTFQSSMPKGVWWGCRAYCIPIIRNCGMSCADIAS